jgi:hypothetical protein
VSYTETTTVPSPKIALNSPDVRPITTYAKLDREELRDELCYIANALAAAYTDYTTVLTEERSDYLDAYARSPGSSVAAKEREAEYNTFHISREVAEAKAKIESLTVCRDLLVTLLAHA